MMLARKETLFLIVDGVDELGEAKRVQLLEGHKSLHVRDLTSGGLFERCKNGPLVPPDCISTSQSLSS